jgi:hypothetical protein
MTKEDIDVQEGKYTRFELFTVNEMIEREKTHYQWKKHGICCIVLFSQIGINLLNAFLIPCGEVLYWVLFGTYLVICACVTYLSCRVVTSE